MSNIAKSLLIIAIVAVCLCSCTNHDYCNRHFETGVVERVEKSHAYTTFKVCVREDALGVGSTYDWYYFYTNDTLQVGDTVHIGKK